MVFLDVVILEGMNLGRDPELDEAIGDLPAKLIDY